MSYCILHRRWASKHKKSVVLLCYQLEYLHIISHDAKQCWDTMPPWFYCRSVFIVHCVHFFFVDRKNRAVYLTDSKWTESILCYMIVWHTHALTGKDSVRFWFSVLILLPLSYNRAEPCQALAIGGEWPRKLALILSQSKGQNHVYSRLKYEEFTLYIPPSLHRTSVSSNLCGNALKYIFTVLSLNITSLFCLIKYILYFYNTFSHGS